MKELVEKKLKYVLNSNHKITIYNDKSMWAHEAREELKEKRVQ